MAIVKKVSRRFLKELGLGTINFSTDTFLVILMDDAFVFDPETHGTYSAVSDSELATGNGYTEKDKELVEGDAWDEDSGSDIKAAMTWEDALWTASSGNIGPTSGAIVIDDTHANDVVVGHIAFETDVTVEDGLSFELRDLGFDLEVKE